MTPERWGRIDELFDGATRLAPADREGWLRNRCGGDNVLLVEVRSLLEQDELAVKSGFLDPPVMPAEADPEPELASLAQSADTQTFEPAGAVSPLESGGFTPQPAIHAGVGPDGSPGLHYLSQQRLRDLTVLFVFITGLMLGWKNLVLKDPDPSQSIPYAILLATLAWIAFRLSTARPLSPSLLKALELGMIGMIAVVFAWSQYQTMYDFSARGVPMRAQLVMKNRVLITAVLILSYGIYAPVSWFQAALVVGPIAILPFATLVVLYLRHPKTMGWLEQVGSEHNTTPLALLGFDSMLLLILAAGATYGAHTISRLRRQVKEARQLGQYRLVRRLGSGGMGEVYLAEHQFLKRPCALKLIRSGLESGAKALERFEREVRLTATLSHPNTVEIYDYGRTEEGTYYYVMEYLPGLSFEELVARHGPLPPGRVVYLLRQVCQALREAHGAGMIHRDIKPSNIFASRRGGLDDVAKLLDFGLVFTAVEERSGHVSEEGQILGTPLYMSPEQVTSRREIDERSDIYSLGGVAYYLLTGRPPFEGRGISLLIAHARDPVVPPSNLMPEIPADLERVVLHCLSKDRDDRFADAEGLERALDDCACSADWDQEAAALWWRDAGSKLAGTDLEAVARG